MRHSGFAKRVADALGRRIDRACAARPKGTIRLSLFSAGTGAAIGVVVAGLLDAGGGALGAGIGGGLGSLAGSAIAASRARRRSPRLTMNMAMVLDRTGFELYALAALRTKPTDLLVAVPYAQVDRIELGEGWLTVWATIDLSSGHRLELEGVKFGAGPGGDVFAALGKRCEWASGRR